MIKRYTRQKSKFMCYFNLWDAFQEAGCPVCTLVEKDSSRYLDGLLYERVNDVGTRMKLRESLGFCNWHAWKTLGIISSQLGLGIIYEDILRQIEGCLKKVQDSFPIPSRGPFPLRLFRRGKVVVTHPLLGPKSRCPACQHVRFFEKFYLETLLEYISEADFERQFSHSAGICFAHLVDAVHGFPYHKSLPLLIKKQMDKFEALRNEVKEFVRKQDYKYAAEPRGSEVDSWKRALEMVVGKREIFANQMSREVLGHETPLDQFLSGSQQEQRPDAQGKEELQDSAEKMKFENEKWLRKYEELKEEYTKESSRASSLHYIAWKTTEDNKILKMNLAGATAEAEGLAERLERLHRENERLRKLLKIQDSGADGCDKI